MTTNYLIFEKCIQQCSEAITLHVQQKQQCCWLPPVSSHKARGATRAATATALPELLPAGINAAHVVEAAHKPVIISAMTAN